MRRCRKMLSIAAVMLLCAVALFAQGPDTLWTRTIGTDSTDVGRSVRQTADGGYIVCGGTGSGAGGGDVYLVKTDSLGDTLWTKTYGGTDWDDGIQVRPTLDRGYIIAGFTWSFGGGREDGYLIKTDAAGDTLWTKTYGDTGSECFTSIQQTPDSGYIMAGRTSSFGQGGGSEGYDFWLVRTDASGDTLWTRTFGGSTYDEDGEVVDQTTDGGYVIGGDIFIDVNRSDAYLVKTNASGDTMWTRTYGGSGYNYGYSISKTNDGGCIFAVNRDIGPPTFMDIQLIRVDSLGTTIWTKTYATYGFDWIDGRDAVRQTTDGGFIVSGVSDGFAGSPDLWLIRTDKSGDTLWTEVWGSDDEDDRARSVWQTADGGYIIAGETGAWTNPRQAEVYLIKTAPDVGIEESRFTHGKGFICQSTPNPFRDRTSISYGLTGIACVRITVYDILGQKVRLLADKQEAAGSHKITWDGTDDSGKEVPGGVYFLRLDAGTEHATRKLLLVR